MVGWGKASPKWGRQSGIVLPHSTTPPSESPSTLAASALPRLPHPLQTAWGASGETGEEDFGLGKSHVSVLSQSPHSPPPMRVRSEVRGTLHQGGLRARHCAPGGCLTPPPLRKVPVAPACHVRPPGRTPPELCGECGFAEERAGGRRARILHPSTPLPFKEDPLEGGNPGRTSCPGLVAGRKADAAGTSQSRRGLGGALAVRRAELGPHTPRPWGCKGSAVTWWGLQATSFHGGVGRGKREKSKWIKEEMESPGRG